MPLVLFCIFAVTFITALGCRSAAPPVAVSDQPVAINDKRTVKLPIQPAKPLADMSWVVAEEGVTAGQRVEKLRDHIGKAVILDFWATYCEPCKREIPHLNALLAKYGPDNLHIVGLNVGGEEDRPKIPAFVATTKIDYAIAYPEDDLTNYIFAERSDIPQTAVFDRKGTMITKIIGFNPQIQKELDVAVERAVSSQ